MAATAAAPWIVGRLADVAAFFRRSLATVKGEWRPNGMPGNRGRYDLSEILAWRDRRDEQLRGKSPDAAAKARAETQRAIAEANIAERKDRLMAGQLIEREAVRRLFVQHVAEAKALLDQLPDRITAALPDKTGSKIRRRAKADAQKIVDDACHALADLLAATEEPSE